MHKKDHGNHLLFSNPTLVADLVRHFVAEPWVQNLDFSTLQRVNAKLHAQNLERREGDIIFRVRHAEGGSVYLYLMLEFQSQPDHWMAVRVGAYVFLLYQHLIKEKQITTETGLPPVFPLVLYNGDTPWPSAQRLDELIHLPKGSPLWAWQPQLSYHLLEERRYPKEAGNSLVGLLFEMENFENVAHLNSVIRRIDKVLSHTDDGPLRHAFLMWVKHVLASKKPFTAKAANLSSLSEVHDMLSERMDKWLAQQDAQRDQEMLAKAFEQGMGKGI